ncbi:MAG TPA: aminoglycoside phosphotransferase [Streptosporangiaceae bacterium]|jgi:maltokinase
MTFEDSLASWLPAQRWFSGKGAALRDLTITADTTLMTGDPELRHLIVSVTQDGQLARYQVLVGIRPRLPDAFRHVFIGPAADGRAAYDALHDQELTSVLLRNIVAERAVGAVTFGREPGALIEPGLSSIVLTAEQSNTSLIFGEAAILKVLRKVFTGCNPDLEVTSALARRGSPHVAEPLGWFETRLDGEPLLLAVLSRYLPTASDGWSLAGTSVRDLYAANRGQSGQRISPQQAGGDFAGEARRLGAATAEVHADLAAAFGTGELAPQALHELTRQMIRRLEHASAQVPELAEYEDKLRAYFTAADTGHPQPVQRIHGDYHLGQVLRTPTGWVALDFEGEPAVPLEQRRAPWPAIRDVAGMLRSFDYVARHQLLGNPDSQELRPTAVEWVERSQAAFCAGYAGAGGADPDDNAPLLRALILDKAVYEVVYEARYRPSWLPIPLDSIAAAL